DRQREHRQDREPGPDADGVRVPFPAVAGQAEQLGDALFARDGCRLHCGLLGLRRIELTIATATRRDQPENSSAGVRVSGVSMAQRAGLMFWFRWNTLRGSHVAFSAASRASFAAG